MSLALLLTLCVFSLAQGLSLNKFGIGKPEGYDGSLKFRLPKVGAPFSFDMCDSPQANWIIVKNLAITPDPIVLGNPLTVVANVVVGSVLSNTTFQTLGLTIETKSSIGVWIEIPCVDGIGSCTLDGPALCGQLQQHQDKNCPKLKPYGLPCVCPFYPNTYKTPAGGLVVQTKNPNIGWLTDGDFYVKAQIQATSGEVLCLEVYFSLSS